MVGSGLVQRLVGYLDTCSDQVARIDITITHTGNRRTLGGLHLVQIVLRVSLPIHGLGRMQAVIQTGAPAAEEVVKVLEQELLQVSQANTSSDS